jgi:hypothetical protein
MNHNDIELKLTKWLTDFVEVPNPKLGDWSPCPFARQARLNNKISIKFSSIADLTQAVRESVVALESKEVVVVCFDHNNIDPVEFQAYVEGMNKTLVPSNYVILEDHPSAPEYINGVCMNFGHCGLLVIQRLDKLNKASDQLQEKGYYDSWSKKDLDSVVTWRYK